VHGHEFVNAVFENLIEHLVEQKGNTVGQIGGVERVLLHLGELVALEDVGEEPLMGFFERVQVFLETFVRRV